MNFFLFLFLLSKAFGLHCFSCKHFLRDKDKILDGKCVLFPKPKTKNDFSKKQTEIDFYYSSTAREFKDMCGEKATRYG